MGEPPFLVRTSDCWGQSGPCDSSGVQQRLLDQIREIVASGTTLVDLWSLSSVVDGGLRQALIDRVLKRLQADVQAANPAAHVVAALMTNAPVCNGFSWNHSKIVAADSSVALAKGINMWPRSYLQSDSPTTDIGVEVRGPAAANAHRFLDVLWRFGCANSGFHLRYNITIVPKEGGPQGCPAIRPPEYPSTRAPEPGSDTGDATVRSGG
jgi:phosphatidylserine/phosphatidylglycerophosphate/cardiolipin synthase-like enzyme